MISNDALWTQLQTALADLAMSQDVITQLRSERDDAQGDLAASRAECARLREALTDLRECHRQGGFVQPDEAVLSNADTALELAVDHPPMTLNQAIALRNKAIPAATTTDNSLGE